MTFILTVTIIWVVLLFMTLPFFVHVPNQQPKGHASSAPEHPYFGTKILISLILSIILGAIYNYFN